MIYAFDFGGSSIKGIKFDDKQKKVKQYHIEYQKFEENGINVDLSYALGLIKTLMHEEKESNISLGISLPGVIDSKNKKILTNSAFVNVNVDIDKFFAENKNIKKIVIQNDGKSALLGEMYFSNKLSEDKNVLFLTIGTSVGGAAWVNGELLSGRNWFAGEYTKMFSDIAASENVELAVRHCGTMQACYRYAMMKNLDFKDVNGKLLVEKLEEKDKIAELIFDNWTSSLAKFIANIDLVLDVDAILLGGGISEYEPFIGMVNEKLRFASEKINLILPEVKSSVLKNEAACFGVLHEITVKK